MDLFFALVNGVANVAMADERSMEFNSHVRDVDDGFGPSEVVVVLYTGEQADGSGLQGRSNPTGRHAACKIPSHKIFKDLTASLTEGLDGCKLGFLLTFSKHRTLSKVFSSVQLLPSYLTLTGPDLDTTVLPSLRHPLVDPALHLCPPSCRPNVDCGYDLFNP